MLGQLESWARGLGAGSGELSLLNTIRITYELSDTAINHEVAELDRLGISIMTKFNWQCHIFGNGILSARCFDMAYHCCLIAQWVGFSWARLQNCKCILANYMLIYNSSIAEELEYVYVSTS